jgi:hypothetical protein
VVEQAANLLDNTSLPHLLLTPAADTAWGRAPHVVLPCCSAVRCFFLHRPRLDLFDRILYRVEEMVRLLIRPCLPSCLRDLRSS